MTNWKEYGVPFGEFTKEITREWVYNGFSKEECKERLESGMIKEDANFCYWLENESEVEYEYPLDNNQKENLRKEYEKYSISQDTNTDWRDIHQGFTKKLQKSWKECNFNRKQQVRKWIRIGLQPTDYEFANYLRMEGFQAESSSNLTKLREKYYNWKGGNNQIQRHLLGLFQNQEIVKEIEALQTDERIKRAKLKKYYNYKAEKLSPDYIALQSVTKLWLKAGFTIGEMQQLIKFGFRLSEYQEAKQWKDKGFTFTQVSRWISVGLKTNEYDFAIYLTKKGFQPSTSNIKEVIINETWQNIHSSFSYHQRKRMRRRRF